MRTGLAALLVLGALAAAGCQEAGGETFQHSFNQPLRLGEEPVAQTFRPATGAVAGVDVLLATFSEPVDPDGELDAVLRDGAGGPVLARATLRHADIGNDEWAAIRFDPAVPAPAVGAVELTWDGASPLAVWANAPLDDPRAGNDPYLGGQILLGGEPGVGDLAFRVVGTGGAAEAAANVARILRSGASRLADRPLFLVLWVAVVAGSGWLGVRGLRGAPPELRDRRRGQERGQHDEARP